MKLLYKGLLFRRWKYKSSVYVQYRHYILRTTFINSLRNSYNVFWWNLFFSSLNNSSRTKTRSIPTLILLPTSCLLFSPLIQPIQINCVAHKLLDMGLPVEHGKPISPSKALPLMNTVSPSFINSPYIFRWGWWIVIPYHSGMEGRLVWFYAVETYSVSMTSLPYEISTFSSLRVPKTKHLYCLPLSVSMRICTSVSIL